MRIELREMEIFQNKTEVEVLLHNIADVLNATASLLFKRFIIYLECRVSDKERD